MLLLVQDYGHVMAIKIASDKRSDSTCILTLRDLRSRGADSCITIAVVTMEKEDFEVRVTLQPVWSSWKAQCCIS